MKATLQIVGSAVVEDGDCVSCRRNLSAINAADEAPTVCFTMTHYETYTASIDKLRLGTVSDWQEMERTIEGFPHGCDDFIGRRWILNAVDCGSSVCIRWMIGKGVELRFTDAEGRSVLHACIEDRLNEREEVLRALIDAGADIGAFGRNGWTPLHLAAVRNNIACLKMLIAAGADPSVRTPIDRYTTAEEEALRVGHHEAVAILKAARR